jgi:hypothetical protein
VVIFMAAKSLNVKVLQVVNTTAQWAETTAATTTAMDKGLLGIETTTSGGVHAKVGDGNTLWGALPYITDPTVDQKIADAISALGSVTKVKGTVASTEALEAIEDPEPGDVYFVGSSDPENPTEDDFQEYIYIKQEVETEDPENPGETTTETVGKLEKLGAVNTAYELPIASSETLGGIKVGANLEINDQTGVLSAAIPVFQGATAAVAPADPEDPEDEGTPAKAGVAGLVPAPAATDLGKVLGASGQWVELPDTSDLESRVDEIEENYISEADLVTIQCTL